MYFVFIVVLFLYKTFVFIFIYLCTLCLVPSNWTCVIVLSMTVIYCTKIKIMNKYTNC